MAAVAASPPPPASEIETESENERTKGSTALHSSKAGRPSLSSTVGNGSVAQR